MYLEAFGNFFFMLVWESTGTEIHKKKDPYHLKALNNFF